MHQIAEVRLARLCRHFTRHDAHRWWRCDAERYRRFDPRFQRGRWPVDRKANFNPNQSRIPAGSEGAGRWTDDAQLTLIADKPGPSAEPPLDKPPAIPPARPSTPQKANAFLKATAYWVARAVRVGTPVGRFVAALEALSWFDPERPYFEAYQDPPKTLEELQDAVSDPKKGYNIHHVVEQASAEDDGFPRSMIDAPENKVRIPALTHWDISAWYSTRNKDFEGLSPRDYLRGKDWEERVRIGHSALVKFGALKP